MANSHSTSSLIGRDMMFPLTGLPLRGIALPILPISSLTGNWSIVRGWKCRHFYHRLDMSTPHIFWAEAVRLRWPASLLKKYSSHLAYSVFDPCIPILAWNLWGTISHWDRILFSEKAWTFSFLNLKLFFFYIKHPPAPEKTSDLHTTCNKKLAHMADFYPKQEITVFWTEILTHLP